MILKETHYATISADTEKNIGKIKWSGGCTSQEYRGAFEVLLEEQLRLGIFRFMSNIREQAVISPEDRKWFETVAMPKAVEQGLKAAAVVFNGNVFKKYYINVILQATNKYGLPLKVFTEVEPAEEWLMTFQ